MGKHFRRIMSVLLLTALPAWSQLEEIQTKQPNVVSGQLFTVRIVPAGRKVQIFVVGNQIANMNLKKVNVITSLKSGSQIWSLEPVKKQDHFLVKTPSDLPSGAQPDLNVKVQYEEKSEDFDFKVDSLKK